MPEIRNAQGPEEVSWEYLVKFELPRVATHLQIAHRASHEEAKECAQEALTTCWSNRATIQNMNAYLRTVAARQLYKRPAKPMLVPLEDVGVGEEPVAHTPSPAAEAENRETNAVILQAIGALPYHQRVAIALALDGYQPAEIASITGSTPQAVRTSLSRARATLKTSLASLRKKDGA
ncbi:MULTISPECIES: RNA polymerase sigma factor [Nocardiopsis]|uniref:RNA polymerase sigma factor n=1 Tax=Nocardiopsis TaxID=2013 RepID=UPI0014780E69|nr:MULTISPECIES: sigma-70 family RNA polymerase sigma factor [Nocardiopsis]